MLRVNFTGYDQYTTDRVYQWDLNHTLSIEGLTLSSAPTIQFCNKTSETAIVVQSTITDGVITAPVPNVLLEAPYNIIAYIHGYDNNNAKTIETINIPLVKRAKPDDYQFTDNVDVMNFERLEADITAFEEDVNETIEEMRETVVSMDGGYPDSTY